ncbi:type II toxin-antitoxin system HigA family antitoxin [Ferruginibacter sp. HRS2-29]|uniref:helix-turn-helix domain-containing protein n=1 Tax=Ferruginibacter sp. HRS2-29 TaxID=2487334 RepID=UPI0020CD47F6|nr:transcriptional regulator [Ferruginibacter sp. HRS2-29]MCP9752757.1 XRE family transcriptional regulator [Ferruginibacter sp. HRS2-29]
MTRNQWFLIENKKDYQKATERYEQIREAVKGTSEHKEKLLLAFLIGQYEKTLWDLPELDPIELIKIRMEDFGYKPIDLANEYGDKGTVSKVLNYKKPLSLSMIRIFSKMLNIPSDSLTKEYRII